MPSDGIDHFVSRPDSYSYSYEPIEGSYSIRIDLSDLDSNIGKTLYDDGKHKIVVDWIDNTGFARTGGYRIGFRAVAVPSRHGATQVSGIKIAESEDVFSGFSAVMTVMYNSRAASSYLQFFDGSPFGKEHRHDGSVFSFYIFPAAAYHSRTVSLQEQGTVTLTVSGLVKNTWRR
jgi:hypothetical protein